MGEKSEQMSIRISEVVRAVHVERKKPAKEINSKRKCLKEKTDDYLARNLS